MLQFHLFLFSVVLFVLTEQNSLSVCTLYQNTNFTIGNYANIFSSHSVICKGDVTKIFYGRLIQQFNILP